ncbi:MAG TPA: TIGR03067 domain-containing protein, partial [Gemmataceae bacterium]|nr:TIGR03067 domain-containing protein [Gemmataceae bacterium]
SLHVSAKAGDADLDLIVDTGAGRNVIRAESAGRAKATPVLFPWMLGSLFSWEGGVLALGDRPALMLRGTIPALAVGPATLKDVRVLMPEWPELKAAHKARGWPVPDGILGHGTLAACGAFIDVGDMALYLAERADVAREELRGKWVAGHVERGGRSTSAGKRPEWAFEFTDGGLTVRAPGGTRAYRVKTNPTTEPMTLDLEAAGPATSPDLPDRWTGIYLFASGGLYLCLSPDGRRPAAFETGSADQFVLFALARNPLK